MIAYHCLAGHLRQAIDSLYLGVVINKVFDSLRVVHHLATFEGCQLHFIVFA